MYRLAKIFPILIVLFFLQLNNTDAQITSSPYSIFGLGQLEGNSVGASDAMGGTGIAFLSDQYINVHNPASYCGFDSLVTIFQVGAFGKYTNFANGKTNQSLVDANIRYVLMGFRIKPWLATSFGITPYSSIGYNITVPVNLEGTNTFYNKKYSGDGGVNQFYLGNSFKITKNLSLGINASYLFGNITQNESSSDFNFLLSNVTSLSNFSFNYGLNYQFNVKKWKYNLGLIYGGAKRLGTNNETSITTSTGKEVLKSRSYDFSLPENFGAGLAVRKDFFKAGIDVELSKWKDVDFKNSSLKTRNSNRYSFGVEFPSQGLRKGTYGMIYYRIGGEYRGSYFVVKDEPINYYAATFGVGLPLKGMLNTINISLELGQNGTVTKGLFRENFVGLHLDLGLKDVWFKQRKYE